MRQICCSIVAFTILLILNGVQYSFCQTPLFTEIFDEPNGATSGTSAEGIGWSSTWVQLQPGVNFSVSGGRFENNNSKGLGTWISNPIDVSNCKRIIFSMDYQSSLPWPGSGNMELCSECAGCLCNPYAGGVGGCFNCWDFIYVELILDGNVVYTEMVGTSNTSQTYTFSYDQCQSQIYNNAEIKVMSQTWAGNEFIYFDNIALSCYEIVDVLSLPPAGPFCQTDSPVTLSGTPAGGSYSGPGISGSTFNPAAAGPGMHPVSYSTLVNGCPESAMITIEVTPSLTPELAPAGPFCVNDAAPSLPSVSNNGIPGTWNPAIINTSASGSSIYTFTPNDLNCTSTNSITVLVEDAITPIFQAIDPHCVNATAPNLPGSSNNSPPITGTWNPAIISTNTPGTSTYTFTPSVGQCAATTTLSVTITDQIIPVINAIGPFCQNEVPPGLPALSNNNPPLSGSWNPAVINTGAAGTNTYTFTPDDDCAGALEVMITIDTPVIPTFSDIGPLCAGSAAPVLPGSSSDNPSIMGSWNPSMINTSNTGTSVYTFTPSAGQCAESATLSITITDQIQPQFDIPSQFCQNADELVLPANSINTPSISGNWNPSVVQTGTAGTSTYTFTPDPGQCASGFSIEITINAQTVPIFDPISNICQNSSAPSLPGNSLNNPPITGTWNPAVINTSVPGNFSYTFTPDAGVCASTANIQIEIVEETTPVFLPIDPICQDETAPVLPSSSQNTPPVTGTWNPPVISTGVPGNTTYIFTPSAGQCAEQVSVSVEVVESIIPTFDQLGPFCLNGNAGSLPASSNNANPVTGTWSPSNINTSVAGTFTYTFTPANSSCASVTTMDITIAPGFDLQLLKLGDVSCSGVNDGSISLTVLGGPVLPLNISWTSPAGTSLAGQGVFDNLPSGTYTVTVADHAGCQTSAQVMINSPGPLSVNCENITPETSPGAGDGSAAVNISGGTAPFQIQVNGPVNNQFNNALNGVTPINGLSPGLYQVIVMDANNCTGICSFFIQEADCDLTAIVIENIDPLCFGDFNGSISIDANSSQQPIEYSWSGPFDPGNTPNAQNLPAGMYSVTISDFGGCSVIIPITLDSPEPTAFLCSALSNASSDVNLDGSAEIVIYSGQVPISIQITGPVNSNLNNVSAGTYALDNLGAGSYQVIITDANGCVYLCDFEIGADQCLLTINNVITENVTCASALDGSIFIQASGGSDPLMYQWSNAGIGNTAQANDLGAGVFSVTVTDNAGCSASTDITIIEPAPVSLQCEILSNATSELSADGSARVVFSGGTAPYSINLSGPVASTHLNQPGPEFAWVSSLLPGNYTVEITDANNCTATCSFIISFNLCDVDLEIMNQSNPLCFGEANGRIELVTSGGNGNYTYLWSGPVNPGNTGAANNLSAGTYSITVSDGQCTDSTRVTLLDPLLFQITCTAQNSDPGEDNGTISIEFTGGIAPYLLSYSNGSHGGMHSDITGNFNIQNLPPGTYIVIATDQSGCTASCQSIINNSDCALSVSLTQIAEILCFGNEAASLEVNATGSIGTLLYSWSPAGLPDNAMVNDLPAGIYSVTVMDETSGCLSSASIQITQPIELILQCSTDPVSGAGNSDGELIININGGIAPYTIEYTGPLSGSSTLLSSGEIRINNLQEGAYSILVRDMNGCSIECNTLIEAVTCNLEIEAQFGNISCFGESDGMISINTTGQVGDVVFTWTGATDPGNVASADQLAAGSYMISAMDENGCTDDIMITLSQPGEISLVCQVIGNESTPMAADGGAILEINGGTAPYNIVWSGPVSNSSMLPGPGTFLISNLNAGVYSVIITDANNCIQECSFEIMIDQDCSGFQLSCVILEHPGSPGSADGSFLLSWTGHLGDVNIQINGPNGISNLTVDQEFTETNAVEGIYNILVITSEGCIDSCSFELIAGEIPCNIQVRTNILQPETCDLKDNGAINIEIIQAILPVSFTWSDQSTEGPARTNLPAGLYYFTITDALGCIYEDSVEISEAPVFKADFEIIHPNCDNSNGSIIVSNISGGTPPYRISIDDIVSTFSLVPYEWPDIPSGEHMLEILDQKNCRIFEVMNIDTLKQVAIIPYTDQLIKQGEEYTIIVQPNYPWNQIDSSAIFYNGELLCSQCQQHSFSPLVPGIIEMIVIDEFGCESTSRFNIRLINQFDVFIPSAFSPNGDNINDIFSIYGGNMVEKVIFLRVFDRWGEEVFLLRDFVADGQQGWDGRFKENELNPAVFVYSTEIQFINGIRKIYTGDITLKR